VDLTVDGGRWTVAQHLKLLLVFVFSTFGQYGLILHLSTETQIIKVVPPSTVNRLPSTVNRQPFFTTFDQ